MEYARVKGFNPLISENWYEQIKDLISQKEISKVVSYHSNNISDALVELFPDVGFDRSKLKAKPDWHSEENRRDFFVKYATDNGFDPLIPTNWYSHPRGNIMAAKGASRVIHYHNDSVVQSLLELFPNTGLDKAKFSRQFYKSM